MASRSDPGVALGPRAPTSSMDNIKSYWWSGDAKLTQLSSLVLFCFGFFPLEFYTFLHWCFFSCVHGLLAILSQQPYLWLKFCLSHLSTDYFPALPLPVGATNPSCAGSGSSWEKRLQQVLPFLRIYAFFMDWHRKSKCFLVLPSDIRQTSVCSASCFEKSVSPWSSSMWAVRLKPIEKMFHN